jgi:hypothetical protein
MSKTETVGLEDKITMSVYRPIQFGFVDISFQNRNMSFNHCKLVARSISIGIQR